MIAAAPHARTPAVALVPAALFGVLSVGVALYLVFFVRRRMRETFTVTRAYLAAVAATNSPETSATATWPQDILSVSEFEFT